MLSCKYMLLIHCSDSLSRFVKLLKCGIYIPCVSNTCFLCFLSVCTSLRRPHSEKLHLTIKTCASPNFLSHTFGQVKWLVAQLTAPQPVCNNPQIHNPSSHASLFPLLFVFLRQYNFFFSDMVNIVTTIITFEIIVINSNDRFFRCIIISILRALLFSLPLANPSHCFRLDSLINLPFLSIAMISARNLIYLLRHSL